MIKMKELKVIEDDRGSLFEMVHDYDLSKPHGFGQVYVVRNRAAGIVRAFHKHNSLWDYFTIVNGAAKFCFVDSMGSICRSVVTSDRAATLITVPPGVFHGWMSLEPNTLLLSVGSEVYNKTNPDEIRVFPDSFDDLFKATYGSRPWVIEGR